MALISWCRSQLSSVGRLFIFAELRQITLSPNLRSVRGMIKLRRVDVRRAGRPGMSTAGLSTEQFTQIRRRVTDQCLVDKQAKLELYISSARVAASVTLAGRVSRGLSSKTTLTAAWGLCDGANVDTGSPRAFNKFTYLLTYFRFSFHIRIPRLHSRVSDIRTNEQNFDSQYRVSNASRGKLDV